MIKTPIMTKTSCKCSAHLPASIGWRTLDTQLDHQSLTMIMIVIMMMVLMIVIMMMMVLMMIIRITFEKPLSATGWSQWWQVRQSGCQEALRA